ncbi:MAG: PARG family protein [Lachnospiraceae bacterium]|nr:PARG family protein [Lachnospiraceae bacterium]
MRTSNIAIFEDTLTIARQGHYLCDGVEVPLQISAEQMTEVQAFSPERIRQLADEEDRAGRSLDVHENIQTWVSGRDSYEAAIEMLKSVPAGSNEKPGVLVLNFANPVHPGGGVTRGASAQEVKRWNDADSFRFRQIEFAVLRRKNRDSYNYDCFVRHFAEK